LQSSSDRLSISTSDLLR